MFGVTSAGDRKDNRSEFISARALTSGGVDADLLQSLGLAGELRLAGREPVDAEHVGENIDVFLPAQPSRLVRRHGPADSLEQVAGCQSVPIGEKPGAGERWRFFSGAGQQGP